MGRLVLHSYGGRGTTEEVGIDDIFVAQGDSASPGDKFKKRVERCKRVRVGDGAIICFMLNPLERCGPITRLRALGVLKTAHPGFAGSQLGYRYVTATRLRRPRKRGSAPRIAP
jgi:hypothetical protein